MSKVKLGKPKKVQRQPDYAGFDTLPSMLTVDELAEFLRISRAGAYNLIATDGFPTLKVGKKRVVIPLAGLVQWVEQQK